MILPSCNETLERARQVIAAGGVIAFRTDTFYGLGADPHNPIAVAAVRELKGREDGKPILLLICDPKEVDRLVSPRSPLFNQLADSLWPGPLTLVGNAREELCDAVTSGTGTVGVRLPDSKRVINLVKTCGGALTATSANPSGKLPALTAEEVESYFPGLIEVIIDDGEVLATEPSTIVDVTTDQFKIVREGAISRQELEEAVKMLDAGC